MPITVLIPTIGWAWPALAPIVGGVAAAMGYRAFAEPTGILRGRTTRILEEHRLERVPLDAVLAEVIAEEIGREERLRFERDDLVLIFRKDALGKFFVEILGPRVATAFDLKIRGEEFARELVRKFVYHRVIIQLERIGAVVVEEAIEGYRVSLVATRWNARREEFHIHIEHDGRLVLEAEGVEEHSFRRIAEFLEQTIGPPVAPPTADPPEARIDLRYRPREQEDKHITLSGN